MQYDIAIIGSGPGGHSAAIRASNLGLKTILIEKQQLGGICLNHGCIPTKTLLKSSEIIHGVGKSSVFGLNLIDNGNISLSTIIDRVNVVGNTLRKGIEYSLKTFGVESVFGTGRLIAPNTIEIESDGVIKHISANNVLLATGASPRILPGLEPDGVVWTYKEALRPKKIPQSLLIIGSGAIGSELAWFYNSIGAKVYLCEMMDRIIPLEDIDMSQLLERSFKKAGIKVYVGSKVERLDKNKVLIKTAKKEEVIEIENILSAVGIVPNIANIGLETVGITTNGRFVNVDANYQTSLPNHYAIGDLISTPALAHVAEAEGNYCADYIAGKNPQPVDYNRIPSCIYTELEIASVGKQATNQDNVIVGTCSMASIGKAVSSGQRDGMVKLVFDNDSLCLLGAQLAGMHVTEMISGLSLAIKMKATAYDLVNTIFPHPTLSEAIRNAAESIL